MLRETRLRLVLGQILLSVVALLMSCWTGWVVSYAGNDTFGTAMDYLTALLWGLGFDQTLRGFPAIARIFTPSADAA